MTTIPAATSAPSLPAIVYTQGHPLPTDPAPVHAGSGNGRDSASAAADAFASYPPQGDGTGVVPGGSHAPAPLTTVPAPAVDSAAVHAKPVDVPAVDVSAVDAAAVHRPAARTRDDIDAMAVLERIAGEWKQAGVDPAWVAIIKAPQTWCTDVQANGPAVLKLLAELQRTGEFASLRRQAIRLIRAAPLWSVAVDRKTAEQHVPSTGERFEFRRTFVEHALVARFFALKDTSPNDNVNTLALIVNAKTVADCLTPPGGSQAGTLSADARAFMAAVGLEVPAQPQAQPEPAPAAAA